MAGIKAAIQDVLSILNNVDVESPEGGGATQKLYSRIWNNQTRDNRTGKTYSYPVPAAFVEVVSPADYMIIGESFRAADIAFRIHIEHNFFNDEGNWEQDLKIFDLRDIVLAALHGKKPAGCGTLIAGPEGIDYDHDNVNEYTIDFLTNFTDDTVSKKYILHQATSLETPITKTFNIPQ